MRSRLSRSAGAAGGTTSCSSNLEHGRVPPIWRAGTIHLVTRMAADGGDGGAELSHPAAGPEPGRGHRPACLHPAEIPARPRWILALARSSCLLLLFCGSATVLFQSGVG